MFVMKCQQTVFCDVDDTLVMWNATPDQLEKRGITIECPISTYYNEEGEQKTIEGWTQRLLPHRKHIDQLIKHKLRGHTVIVWSAGGYDWAEAVVKALKLEKIVDLVISKPIWTYDDLQPIEFIPKPQYCKDYDIDEQEEFDLLSSWRS